MDLPDISLTAVLAPLYAVIEVVGIASAVHAAMRVRTAQGSFAWCLALIAFPAISLPLWWVFGRRKIHGYLQTIRDAQDQNQGLVNEVYSALEVMRVDHGWLAERDLVPLERLSDRRFTVGNCVKLLVNGEETFGAIFEAIDAAEHYILVEYYIVADDQIGGEFQRKLIEKVRAGVRVHFLYDEIGSYELPKRYVSELREAGCDASAFKTTIGKTNRFQINFRNHRKIVVVDGHTAFVGGLNVADDYLGRNPEYGHWRDTHLRLHGPSALAVQLCFLADWYWATRTLPPLRWKPVQPEDGSTAVLALPTAPIDDLEACAIFYLHAIGRSRRRLWIASPYFVPDEAVSAALQVAALRGVDVRILITGKVDHKIVEMAGMTYVAPLAACGVQIFRYTGGFLHQKVLLSDNDFASVGTANLDNRSLRLNFELTAAVADEGFAAEVAAMLKEDFRQSQLIPADFMEHQGVAYRAGARLARMIGPIL